MQGLCWWSQGSLRIIEYLEQSVMRNSITSWCRLLIRIRKGSVQCLICPVPIGPPSTVGSFMEQGSHQIGICKHWAMVWSITCNIMTLNKKKYFKIKELAPGGLYENRPSQGAVRVDLAGQVSVWHLPCPQSENSPSLLHCMRSAGRLRAAWVPDLGMWSWQMRKTRSYISYPVKWLDQSGNPAMLHHCCMPPLIVCCDLCLAGILPFKGACSIHFQRRAYGSRGRVQLPNINSVSYQEAFLQLPFPQMHAQTPFGTAR